jgi:hypothetical protein
MAVFVLNNYNPIRTFEKINKLCQKIKKVFIQESLKKMQRETISAANIYWNNTKKTMKILFY